MTHSKKLFALAAVLIGTIALGAPSTARAAYDVRVYDDGVLQGGIGVLVIGNSLVFTGTTTHFDITNGAGSSNNPGTNPNSHLSLSSNEQITTTFGATGGTHTIRIELSQTGWTAPTGTPLTLSSSAGGSYIGTQTGNSVTSTYQGFLDNTNTLFGQPVAGSTPLQSATANGSGNPNLSTPLVFGPGTVNAFAPGGVPFSMTDVLTFSFTTVAGSGQDTANVAASTVASVPAPAGLFLVIAGLPCLGAGAWLRRRVKAA